MAGNHQCKKADSNKYRLLVSKVSSFVGNSATKKMFRQWAHSHPLKMEQMQHISQGTLLSSGK